MGSRSLRLEQDLPMDDPIAWEPAGPRVFVSYASADLRRVRRLVAALGRAGVPTWLDRDLSLIHI